MSGRDDRPERDRVAVPDEPFLSRWSRLKRESSETAPDESATPAAQEQPDAAAAPVATDKGEPAARAGTEDDASPELPSLDSLTSESDFGPFMHGSVDPALRRLALRKMFRNPKYAVLDPLDPYRADYGAFTPLGDIITSDMKFHAERLLREELEKAAEAAESAGTASPDADEDESVAGEEQRTAAAAPDTAAPAGESMAQDESTETTEDGDERREI
jgi:hypothetical protein